MEKQKIRFLGDTLGLAPLPLRFKQALVTIRGEEDVPPSRWGFSSLKQLYPKVALKLWRGSYFIPKKVIISNLFNHTPTAYESGWSVRKTQTLDFRGRGLTYDSHNGTDFAIPVGTKVCTAAAGKVVHVVSEFNRGGLKIFVDHGEGLMTCYAHLAKSLVQIGDRLHRGQIIAVSGYSGIDGAVTFPFGIPHIHFNVWLNGLPIDPFAVDSQISLWMNGVMPGFAIDSDSHFVQSEYNSTLVMEAMEGCKTLSVKERLLKLSSLEEMAVHVTIEMNYYPTRFSKHVSVYSTTYLRKPMLDLPFSANDFDGVVFLDDLPLRRNKNKLV